MLMTLPAAWEQSVHAVCFLMKLGHPDRPHVTYTPVAMRGAQPALMLTRNKLALTIINYI